MKHLIVTTALALALTPVSGPALAQQADAFAPLRAETGLPGVTGAEAEFDKKGRKRGGRSKPRIPGGSGCDDPGDILEHPECAG